MAAPLSNKEQKRLTFLARKAHDRVWKNGLYSAAEYSVEAILEPSSAIRFMVYGKFTTTVEGEEFNTEGPVAAFVHEKHAQLFMEQLKLSAAFQH